MASESGRGDPIYLWLAPDHRISIQHMHISEVLVPTVAAEQEELLRDGGHGMCVSRLGL